MSKYHASMPLAFVLAIAAENSAVALPDMTNPTTALRAGDLRQLLSSTDHGREVFDPNTESGDRQLPKTSQFFPNFFSCISGYWRRC
jgi:hypothetical protein